MRRSAAISLLCALCVIAVGLATAAGPGGLSGDAVLFELRAPRVALAAVVGASLAVAGVAMQTLLRNDLADPYVLGLSGGASVGAVVSLALAPGLPAGPAAAAGAAGTAALVRLVARGPHDPGRLILGGVAIGSLAASATGLILVLAPAGKLLRSATYWLFGGFGIPTWTSLAGPLLLLAIALAWMLARAERLDRLTLGDDVAASLGVDVRMLRRIALLASILLTASAVAVGGLVGFVGLVAPHAARRVVGARHRILLPTATLMGALLVIVADTLARTAFAPREVPVGLVTAAAGGPLFLWLLSRRRPCL